MSGLPAYRDRDRLSRLIGDRRKLHRIPELSWTEFETTAVLCGELEALGYAVTWGEALYRHRRPHNPPPRETLDEAYARAERALGADNPYLPAMRGGFTGAVATLDGVEPGPVYGFRFDIDALPINESRSDGHAPSQAGFASAHGGAMHACGHDAHMAIGLGLARELARAREHLKGRVHLFFQPAEEVAGGGIIFAGLPQLQETERFLTLHIGIVGERRIVCDATWVAARIFDARILGRSSHAGNAPEDGANALLAACQAVQALYAIPRHSRGVSRVNVGRFRSDNANNVIADEATFRFEVRGGDDDVCDFMTERARRIVQSAAAMNGCEARIVEVTHYASCPNSPDMVADLRAAAMRLGVPETALREAYQVPASEDASFMIRAVNENGGKAAHVVLGCPVRGGHHNGGFDIDEDVLGWGVDVFREVVLKDTPDSAAR